MVPTTAVVQRGSDDYVFMVDGTKAKLARITKGLQKDGVVQVQGVNPGDKIVVSGQNSLDDGSPIRIDDGNKGDAGAKPSGGTNL